MVLARQIHPNNARFFGAGIMANSLLTEATRARLAGALIEAYAVDAGNYGSRGDVLACFGPKMLFVFHPFLKTAFQDAPLPANLEGRNLAVLNHAVQRSF
jgi:hypothetical protein